jgi:hypothetical protein
MKRLLLTALVSSVIVAAVACGDSDPTFFEQVTGEYALNLVDGEALPTEVASTPTEVTTAISGTLFLDPDGAYAMGMTYTVDPVAGGASDTTAWASNGTYTGSGTTIDFSEVGGDTFQGEWSGSTVVTTVLTDAAPDSLELTFRR